MVMPKDMLWFPWGCLEPFRSGWSRATFRLEQGSQLKQFAKLGAMSFCRLLEVSYWRLQRPEYITTWFTVPNCLSLGFPKPMKRSKIQACGSMSTNNQTFFDILWYLLFASTSDSLECFSQDTGRLSSPPPPLVNLLDQAPAFGAFVKRLATCDLKRKSWKPSTKLERGCQAHIHERVSGTCTPHAMDTKCMYFV